MLDINDITLRFAGRTLFDKASAHISDSERVGLVGRNGSGKSTLFRLILGQLSLDDGEISITKGHRIATVAQEVPEGETSLLDFVLKADTERESLLLELEQAEKNHDGIRIGEIHERLTAIQSGSAVARASSILFGLGFSNEDQLRPVNSFSGGFRMRVALATTLFIPSEILLLDEPTNHLDLESTLWLENHLSKYTGTLVMISHDRSILNSLCTRILHIENLKLQSYSGNYDIFEKTRALQKTVLEKQALKTEERRKHLQSFVDRFRYKASKAKQAQSRIKMLERLDPIQVIPSEQSIRFNFPSPQELSPPLLRIEDGIAGYGEKVILRNLNLRIDSDDRIALLGANGNGKSTLAKIFSNRLALLDGKKHASHKLQVGYFAQHQTDELNRDLTAFQQMKLLMDKATETEIRTRLGSFGLSQQRADTKIESLSGGEKSRLLFALMSKNAPHILILDEPTNHLDIDSRNALIEAINDYKGAVILITHDPHIIELTADRLLLVANGTCAPFDGDLEDYRKFLSENAKIQSGEKSQKQKEKEVGPSRKDERREAAEKRQSEAPLRKEMKEIEKKLEKLSQKSKKIQSELENPALYEQPDSAEKITSLQLEKASLSDEISALESRWLEITSELDL